MSEKQSCFTNIVKGQREYALPSNTKSIKKVSIIANYCRTFTGKIILDEIPKCDIIDGLQIEIEVEGEDDG